MINYFKTETTDYSDPNDPNQHPNNPNVGGDLNVSNLGNSDVDSDYSDRSNNSGNSDVIRVIRIADIFNKDNRGAAALLTVIIVGVTSLILAYSASILSLGELEMGFSSQKGSETESVVDGCLEDAMQRLKIDQNYSGGSLNVGFGSCIISIESNGNDKVVTATASVGNNYKIFQIDLTLIGNAITINSWQEI